MDIDYKAIVENNNKYINTLQSKNIELQEKIIHLETENNELKEQLKYFIPRRRVRRVYKMLSKILNQLDYNDGTSNEEADERDIIEKQRKVIYNMAKTIQESQQIENQYSIEDIMNKYKKEINYDNSSSNKN